MEDADGTGKWANAMRRHHAKMYIKVEDGVTDVKFNTWLRLGHRHQPMATEMIKGKPVEGRFSFQPGGGGGATVCRPTRSTVPCWRKRRWQAAVKDYMTGTGWTMIPSCSAGAAAAPIVTRIRKTHGSSCLRIHAFFVCTGSVDQARLTAAQ